MDKRHRLLHGVALATVALSLLIVLGFVAAQAYVRWSINQNFTFLGGNELEALTVSSFALLIALLLVHRSRD